LKILRILAPTFFCYAFEPEIESWLFRPKKPSKYAKLFQQKKKKESWDGKFGSVSPVQQILAQKNLADPHEP